MGIDVRQAERGDIARLFDFIEKAYGDLSRFKIPNRWYWEFTENPYWKDDKLPVWIALDGDSIAGQTCAMRVPIQINGVSTEAAWSVDTIVLREYRGKGVGKLLQKANGNAHRIFMSLSMSKANRHVKAKLGSISLPPVSTYFRLIRLSPQFVRLFLAVRTKNRPRLNAWQNFACQYLFAHRFIAGIFTVPLAISNFLYQSNKRCLNANYTIEEVERFDARIDALWDRLAPFYRNAVKRESAYLNWKFTRQPDLDYRLFILKSGEAVMGFSVLRAPHPKELPIGVIAEVFTNPSDRDALLSLLDHAIGVLSTSVEAIKIAASTEAYRSVISRRFLKARDAVPMFLCTEKGIDAELAARSEWFLSSGDHDWDQVVPAPSLGKKRGGI